MTATVPLGKIALVSTGGTPDRGTPAYWGGTVPWVGTGEIDFNIITTATDYLTEEGLAASAAKLLPPGTLLMAMYGQGVTRGKVGMLGIEAATNQACAAIRPKDDSVESEFLFHVLEASYTRIRQLSNSGGQDNLNTTLIKEIPIPLMNKARRVKLVRLANEWNQALALQAALVENLEQRQQGLMQQLLTGRQRLKGFRKAWRNYRLRDLFAEVTRQPSTPVPVLSISAGRGFLSQKERFNREVSAATLANYTLIERGEFAYNKGNSKTYACGCIYALNEFEAAAIPSVYISFHRTTTINTRFFEFFFEADMLKAQLTRIINSGIRNDGLLNLATKDFFNMQIQVPDLKEQTAIAEVLNEAAEAVRLQKQQLQALQQQKRALLQRLLSGEPT